MASKHRIGDSAKMNLNPEEWRPDLNIPMPLRDGWAVALAACFNRRNITPHGRVIGYAAILFHTGGTS